MLRLTYYRFSLPLITLGLGLAALGATAAWNTHRHLVLSSELIDREVQGLVATQNLYVTMREVRHHLVSHARSGAPLHLREIEELHKKALPRIAEARRLAGGPQELQLIDEVERGYSNFREDFVAATDPTKPAIERLRRWADAELLTAILTPAERCVRLNEEVVTRTNKASRDTSRRLTQGFLFLGFTGVAAGSAIGIAIMRHLRRSLWELHVSVSGATGKLAEVIGPSPESDGVGFDGLRESLRELERRVVHVVAQLQCRESELLRNEQLAALGRLSAGLAHELRNPLMPMKMLVQAALERDTGQLHGRQLSVLRDEIARMEGSIQSFLDFARPPTPVKSRSDFRRVASDTAELVRSRARHQAVELIVHLPDEPCEFEFDTAQMRQVVLNLLLNALDSVGPRGRIQLMIEWDVPPPADSISPADAAVEEDYPQHTRGVLLTVADDGPGIPADSLERIFEPFVSSKDAGTGLGLAISRRIVQCHEGWIGGDNLPEGGARFRAWIPLHQQKLSQDSL
jgi:two-component system sensor histidine kinase HydH